MNIQPLPPIARFRAAMAELLACKMVLLLDPGLNVLPPAELKERALLRTQMDPEFRIGLTLTLNDIESAARMYSDTQIGALLQPGVSTFAGDGRMVSVETTEDKINVTNILDGAALNVADGAFVVFIDSRCSGTEALKKWERMCREDTRIMIIPLNVPKGQTVQQVVAARRQDDSEGFTQ